MIIENRPGRKKAAISPRRPIQFALFALLNVDLPALNSLGPGYIVSSIGKPLPSPEQVSQDQSYQAHFNPSQTKPDETIQNK